MVVCSWAAIAGSSAWTLARSPHFEVYSQAGEDRARSSLQWFEQLRSFFEQSGVIKGGAAIDTHPPVRVIGFRSSQEYDAYRLRATADAYYVGGSNGDYIVMPALGREKFDIAAHEYTHAVLHAGGLQLPSWLEEGLAEVFSTVHITDRRCEFGGALPMRLTALRLHAWLPLTELFSVTSHSVLRDTRAGTAIFYAETWALTNMLIASADYAGRFDRFVASVNAGSSSEDAFQAIYGKSPATITSDLRVWLGRGVFAQKVFPALVPGSFPVTITQLSDIQSKMLIAELLLADGEWNRAQQQYQELLQQTPDNADVLAALGTIALQKHDSHAAVQWWGQALDHDEHNPDLCYRYAVLADDAGLSVNEIERALTRAIAARPDFNDAHYKLAMIENNNGQFEEAVTQLQQIKSLPPTRAFHYWSMMAYALSELGKRQEAESAAQKARQFATTDAERNQAAQLAYVARTDMQVQFTRDADGHLQLTTTRALHGESHWNPFVEPGDQIQSTEGQLRAVQCQGGKLSGFLIQTNSGPLALSVADPTHVLMQNAPPEFNCGPQKGANVKVEYATNAHDASGILRGMEFR